MRVPETTSECDERISKDRYGCFTVLFSNSNGLEEQDICFIFAEFGPYLSIRKAGNKNGIHFVTYETYEEAKRAVDGLEDHPDIQLKVYRKKRRNYYNFNDGYNNNHNNRRRSNGGYDNDARLQRYANRSTNRRFNDHNYAREWYLENGYRKDYRESSVGKETSVGGDDDSDESTKQIVNGESENCELTEDEKSSEYTWLCVQNYLASFNNNNNTLESEQTASVETVAATINTEGEQYVKSQEEDNESIKVTVDEKPLDNSNKMQEEEKEGEEEEDSTSIIQEIVYAQASAVIVGNVDFRLDEAYLLHLFNKYEPIAISQLVPLNLGKVRYCYIYFKNDDVALTVERSFDKLRLRGRQILVQRPRRLIAAYLDQL